MPKTEDRAREWAEARKGIYVASRASVLERGAMWRRHRDAGAPIIATWIDEDGPNDTADLDELWVRICREVTTAARLVMYVEPDDFPLKGAFVEIGMALAAGVPISVVAPGVEINGRNCRPFGSWIKHPLVSFATTVEAALASPAGAGSAEGEPKTTADMIVGAVRFRAGVKVSTVQGAIDRLAARLPSLSAEEVAAGRTALTAMREGAAPPPAPAIREDVGERFTDQQVDEALTTFKRELPDIATAPDWKRAQRRGMRYALEALSKPPSEEAIARAIGAALDQGSNGALNRAAHAVLALWRGE